jgi:hypothetical protein
MASAQYCEEFVEIFILDLMFSIFHNFPRKIDEGRSCGKNNINNNKNRKIT